MLVQTKTKYKELLRRIRDSETITYDLETTGLNPFGQDRLIGVAILVPGVTKKYRDESFYIPFRHLEGKNLPIENLYLLAPFLEDPNRTLIGFNLKFDVHFTEVEQITVNNRLVDVMLAAHLANENEMGFHLKGLSTKYISSDATLPEKALMQRLKDKGYKPKKEYMKHLPPEDVAPYAEQDVILTWKLGQFYSRNLTDQGIYHLWAKINEYLRATVVMERRGVLIDSEECAKSLVSTRRRRVKLYKEMKAIVGHDFNPNSVPQLRKILEQKSTDKDALKKSKHPVALLLRKDRGLGKAETAFYQVFLNSVDSNCRIHPSILLHGTISGRPSCRKPNLQALPKKSTSTYKVRDLILAPPGYVLMSWDWNQAELRLLAHYTKDPFLLDAFRQKKDFHQEVSTMLGIPRERGKRINLGIVYGIGADALSESLDIPRAEAKEYLNRYHRLIPGVRRLYYTAQRIAERDHKIPMWTGRLRHYRKEDAFHKAMSNLIQGGVAEMMRIAITRLHRLTEITNVHQVLQVHDEILFEVPVDREAYWAPVIKDIMEDFKFDVPIMAEGRMGYSWSTDKMQPIGFDGNHPVIPKLRGQRT